jgi:epoxyqueuosine reductase
VTSLAAFEPRETLFAPELEWLASLSQQEFSAVFRGSAVKRAKWRGLVRNACVALGNSSIAPDQPAYPRVIRLLDRLASSEDAMISGHARWALVRLSGSHDQPAPDGLRVRIAESKTE